MFFFYIIVTETLAEMVDMPTEMAKNLAVTVDMHFKNLKCC